MGAPGGDTGGRVVLRGSERAPFGTPAQSALPQEPISVSVVLRVPDALGEHVRALAERAPAERAHVGPEEFADRFGASTDDIEAVRRFAAAHDLEVSRVDRAARTVELSATPDRLAAAFGVDLRPVQSEQGLFRGRSGPVQLPADLADAVVAVLGLDDRPQARPHFRPAAAATASFTPPQLAALYAFPQGVTGSGQTIGIIELGGGYRESDLSAYFSRLGLPEPTVRAVAVDGVGNSPTGDAGGPDGEVVLDIEVAGGVAPGAQLSVYFAPNTDKGFLDAVNQAVADNVSVLSISWGAPESQWTGQAMDAMSAAFQSAAALGISVFVAAGDNGSGDGQSDGRAHADFPASSPYALGCGGTRLTASGTTISSEVVWNEPSGGATGGGVSDHFPVPAYQTALKPTSANPGRHHGRGVPDVAAVADPATGYQIQVDGQQAVFGGTSAVAPLWAGLTALLQQALDHRLAPLHPTLYPLTTGFRDITQGSNGAYSATRGWDACTGLGSPVGSALLTALKG